jgi:hypothetical protein
MGLACEVIAGRTTNPGATLTALTVNTNNSFTVRNYPTSAPAYLDQAWAKEATPGVFRVRSPRLHDQVQGIRMQVGDTTARLLLSSYGDQKLYPSDTLTVELSGGGAETDAGYFNVYYSDLPGIAARLAMWSEIGPRIANLVGVEVDATTSATAGDWSGGTAINATFDNLKANTDYAILGYTVATACGAVAIVGTDTGNLRIGGPGNLDQLVTRDFFVRMAENTGRAYIPVINSNNRGGTLVTVSDPAASTAIHVSLNMAELAG